MKLTGIFGLLFLVAFPDETIAQTTRLIVPSDVGIQVPFGAVGNVLVAGPATSQIQDSAAVSSMNAPSGINFTSNINYGAASGPSNSWLYSQTNISGTPTSGIDGIVSPLHFIIPSDTATFSGQINGLSVKIQPATNHTGFRTALLGYVQINGTPGTEPANNMQYVGIQGYTASGVNLGGTTGVFGNYKGALFGGNSNIFTASGATFLSLTTSWEFDTSLVTGSSAARKHGFILVQGGNDAVRGTFEDSAIEIASQAASTTWLVGLEFGSYSSQWAFGADSTLIGATQRVLPSPDSPIALWGIDFSKVTFQAGGGFLKSTGFLVNPSGNVTGNLFISGTLGSSSSTAFQAPGAPMTGLFFPNVNQVGLCGNGSCGLIVNGAGSVNLGNTTTGTPVASLCLDSSNYIIKKTTTGPCI
jgi:hypothetical protein